MSIQSLEAPITAPTVLEEPDADTEAHRPESPYVVFPALILLLIMPLGIVFHPTWLPLIAEVGALVMFAVIFRLTRL
ncbi:MAG TPA: hypothetical protein VGE72_03205 [Azospirillum sp.]